MRYYIVVMHLMTTFNVIQHVSQCEGGEKPHLVDLARLNVGLLYTATRNAQPQSAMTSLSAIPDSSGFHQRSITNYSFVNLGEK